MANQFDTIDLIKKTSSGDYDKEDVERYISELMSDFSRIKSVMQRNVDNAREEKEQVDKEKEQLINDKNNLFNDRKAYIIKSQELDSKLKDYEAKLAEMQRIQEDLSNAEREKEALAEKLGELEGRNIQSEEDLVTVLNEKKEIEQKNHSIQSEYESALEKIKVLTQEKEAAILRENEAKEKALGQEKQNDDLVSELNNLRSINEKLTEEIDKGLSAGKGKEVSAEDSDTENVKEEFVKKYGTELMTNSGLDLFKMFMRLARGESNNGVRLTRSYEEETEEVIPGETPDKPSVTKKVRTKSEVSVEYIAGRNE